MRKLHGVIAGAVIVAALATAPAIAASPQASCPGRELSSIAPLLGPDLGAFIAFEARNPELEGWRTFGEEISTFAHSDRASCPEE